MSTRERALWVSAGVEVVLAAVFAAMQMWWPAATLTCFAASALLSIRHLRKTAARPSAVEVAPR